MSDLEDKKLSVEEMTDVMTSRHFKATVKTMKLTSKSVVKAAYLVMCQDESHKAAAARFGVTVPHLSKTVKLISKNWEQIVRESGCLFEPIFLPEKEMKLARAVESRYIDPMLAKNKNAYEKYGLNEEFEIEED